MPSFSSQLWYKTSPYLQTKKAVNIVFKHCGMTSNDAVGYKPTIKIKIVYKNCRRIRLTITQMLKIKLCLYSVLWIIWNKHYENVYEQNFGLSTKIHLVIIRKFICVDLEKSDARCAVADTKVPYRTLFVTTKHKHAESFQVHLFTILLISLLQMELPIFSILLIKI